MNGEPARRPGGGARLLLTLAAMAGFFEVLSRGFPPAARDRLPVLALALGLALLAAWDPPKGLLLFSFLFPLAGFGARMFGGADAIAWPVLLFTGFACGWSFRFLYDFESEPDPSSADGALKALATVWLVAAALAVVRARTLWAALHGLRLRAVNVGGLPDAAAIRDSLLAFAALASGVAYFFILRRCRDRLRRRALSWALAGIALSAAAAVGQRLGIAPGEASAFWKSTGRLSGGSMDPNALGVLCGLAIVPATGSLLFAPRRRLFAAASVVLLALGLLLSGSRSGMLVGGAGVAALVVVSRGRRWWGPVGIALALAGVAASGIFLFRGTHGSIGARLAEVLDPRLPLDYRVSARPLLWENALRLFERHPVEGAGLGAFAWQLPNLLSEAGRPVALHDNPGNGYLQALAETGAIGLLLTLLFAYAVVSAPRGDPERSDPLAAASAAAVAAFFVGLLVGSHWFAPDVALFFFLLTAVSAPSVRPETARPRSRQWRWALVGVYAAAALVGALATLSPAETFRYRWGVGFHGREIGSGGPFYWTERRFAVHLKAGETLRVELAHFTPENQPVELSASTGGRRLLRETLRPGEFVALRLSGGPASGRVFRFSVSRAFVPKRLGISSDRRELGVVAVFRSG